MASILFWMVAADAHLAMAAILPPETLTPEKRTAPPEIAPEAEPTTPRENPFEESAKPDSYEAIRLKRERTTIYIILAVVLLLCAYWWTSGKLHHKIPRMK